MAVREPRGGAWKEGRWGSGCSRHRLEMKVEWLLLAMTNFDPQVKVYGKRGTRSVVGM